MILCFEAFKERKHKQIHDFEPCITGEREKGRSRLKARPFSDRAIRAGYSPHGLQGFFPQGLHGFFAQGLHAFPHGLQGFFAIILPDEATASTSKVTLTSSPTTPATSVQLLTPKSDRLMISSARNPRRVPLSSDAFPRPALRQGGPLSA